jgi:hypothetical protein
MDYVLVRTKLQALIVLELIRRGVVEKPFRLVCTHQHRIGEDSESVYALYNQIEAQADRRYDIVQGEGLGRGVARLLPMLWRARLTGGRLFVATINYYPLAVALRLTPGLTLHTFDDGAANIWPHASDYFRDRPLEGETARRRIARLLFPRGGPAFMRGRIARHYTIYPGYENIAPAERVEAIDLDWAGEMSAEDAARLPANVKAILLGAPFQDLKDPAALDRAREALAKSDLYLPHPRDASGLTSDKDPKIMASAEAVIDSCLRQGPLTVYHFASSTILPFKGREGLTLVSLRPEVHEPEPSLWRTAERPARA